MQASCLSRLVVGAKERTVAFEGDADRRRDRATVSAAAGQQDRFLRAEAVEARQPSSSFVEGTQSVSRCTTYTSVSPNRSHIVTIRAVKQNSGNCR
jgi:hypothetical protein